MAAEQAEQQQAPREDVRKTFKYRGKTINVYKRREIEAIRKLVLDISKDGGPNSRAAHIAYGLLRGIKYSRMESACKDSYDFEVHGAISTPRANLMVNVWAIISMCGPKDTGWTPMLVLTMLAPPPVPEREAPARTAKEDKAARIRGDIAHVMNRATRLLKTKDDAELWMNTPNPDLDGETPITLINLKRSQVVIDMLIDAMTGLPD